MLPTFNSLSNVSAGMIRMEVPRPLSSMEFEELKRVVKLPVMDESGRKLGILDKIHVDARRMIAKSAEIKMVNGKCKKVSATKLFYINGIIVFSKSKTVIKPPRPTPEAEPDLVKARGLFDKVKTIRERLMKLDELLIEGKITEATFKILRSDYEGQLKTLMELGAKYVEKFKRRLIELEQMESELAEKLNLYEAKLYIGEITEPEFNKLTRGLKVELERIRSQIRAIRDFLQDYDEEVPFVLPPKVKIEEAVTVKVKEEPMSEGELGAEVPVGEEAVPSTRSVDQKGTSSNKRLAEE